MGKMTVEEWPKEIDEILDGVKRIMKAKNQDYTAGSGDPFSNFRGAESFGMDPLAGLCLRMDDKFQRVKAYFQNGELAVENEGLEDAFKDIIGYSVIALGMLSEKDSGASMEEIIQGIGKIDPRSDPRSDSRADSEADSKIYHQDSITSQNMKCCSLQYVADKAVTDINLSFTIDSPESKPSWEDAPEWANWLAMDEDGEWWWFESKPCIVEENKIGVWTLNGQPDARVRPAEPRLGQAHTVNWKQTLEERPHGI